MLIVPAVDVERLLDPDTLIDAVGEAMAELSAGRASMPSRIAAMVDERDAFLGVMPAYVPSSGALETKLVSVFPWNTDRPTHQAVVVVFDPENGTPVGLLDGTSITEARTAAGSALSARLLARVDAEVLAIVGTGVQAGSHLRYVSRVRAFKRVVIAGREPRKAEQLASEVRADLGAPVAVVGSIEEAVREAGVVCVATHADRPVIRREWLRPGTHVTSVGYNIAGAGELDTDTVADAAVFVESRAAALAPPPAGAVELLRAIEAGRITEDHVRAEVGEVVAGTAPGRESPDEITLYKSVGVAAQDAAAAMLVLGAARREGIGTEIEL
ncbi:MAG TPA: ornithine cyclodeaminase family protein [Propionibacteriaceae bacterium]|nr:ornithine cyclodeaminase family protein [Propionibacteriaceae bacterium]